jgi:dihydropteroate synthase
VPVLRLLARRTRLPLSIDTYKPEVAAAALDAGAVIVNDITGLRYRQGAMADVVSKYRAGVIIMHMQGTPRSMQKNPHYGDVVEDINDFFLQRTTFALEKDIDRRQIILDPGIGFGKTQEDNLAILRRLAEFRSLGFPLLIGASRKSFIGSILSDRPPHERQYGSIGAAAWAALAGAHIVRVHDVQGTVEALKVLSFITTS